MPKPHSYTPREVAKVEKLLAEWVPLDNSIKEFKRKLFDLQGFGQYPGEGPDVVHPRQVAEAYKIASWIHNGSMSSGISMAANHYLKLPDDYPVPTKDRDGRDVPESCAFYHAMFEELPKVGHEYLKGNFESYDEPTVVMLHALNKKIDELKAEAWLLTHAITKIVQAKAYDSIENVVRAYNWLKACDSFDVVYLNMAFEEMKAGTYKKPERKAKLLEDGKLEVLDVPMRTLLKSPCGCIYRRCTPQRHYYDSMERWVQDCVHTPALKLVKPAKKCTETVRHSFGSATGAHGRRIGYKGWSYDKDFSLVKYPDGTTKLKQPKR